MLTVAQFELNLAWKNVSASQALLRKFIDAAEAEEKKGIGMFSLKREREDYNTPIGKKFIFHNVSPPRDLLSVAIEQPRQLEVLFGCAALRKELIALARQPPFFSELMKAVFSLKRTNLFYLKLALL